MILYSLSLTIINSRRLKDFNCSSSDANLYQSIPPIQRVLTFQRSPFSAVFFTYVIIFKYTIHVNGYDVN